MKTRCQTIRLAAALAALAPPIDKRNEMMTNSHPRATIQRRTRRNWVGLNPPLRCGLMLVAAMAFLPAAPAVAGEDGVPEGLSASDWSSIRAAYEANRHAAFAVEGGYQVWNPGQQWRTRFDGRGFVTTPAAMSVAKSTGFFGSSLPASIATCNRPKLTAR